jgi:hypothetical protein
MGQELCVYQDLNNVANLTEGVAVQEGQIFTTELLCSTVPTPVKNRAPTAVLLQSEVRFEQGPHAPRIQLGGGCLQKDCAAKRVLFLR